ncbi:MAG: exo-alpha-sialidase [Planctomycetaceae bacterium]|nr:exo-alpha-sialidase [Planctomycetaceae bacterium]
MNRNQASFAISFCCLLMHCLCMPQAAPGEWQEHQIRQGDGQGGWVDRPAQRQVLKHPDANHTMPFGLASMDNGELVILCSREKTDAKGRTVQAVISFSKDGGATWSDFMSVPGTTDRPMLLTDLGQGRLSFLAPRRFFSSDYGRTWPEAVDHPLTKAGMTFGVEGNAWVDRDEQGRAKAILEVGWHYAPGKVHPKDDATGQFRRSLDGGKTWIDEVTPPQWKYIVEHKGKKWPRGVSEGAIARAANGDLVAALRTDMPPKYFDGPHDDSLEGTAISISKDDGRTWSEMQFLFEAGRHHANLQRLSNGDLVCTLVVRDDIQRGKRAEGQLTSRRRGCDALVSRDHGQTWNLERRYELDGFDYLREDGYWVDGKVGHVGAVALPDGQMLCTYGDYQRGAALVKWKPDGVPAGPKGQR